MRSCEWLGAYSGELVDGDDLLGGDAHERQQLVGAGQQVFGCHVALRQPLHASHGGGDDGWNRRQWSEGQGRAEDEQ